MHEKIKQFLERETGRVIENPRANLIESGILDSFSMAKLIAFLEHEFAIEMNVEELSPEIFNSLESIEPVLVPSYCSMSNTSNNFNLKKENAYINFTP